MKQEVIDKYNNDLDTCPFCGGEAKIQLFLGRYSIVCTNCPAFMVPSPVDYDEYQDTFSIVECWNSRW